MAPVLMTLLVYWKTLAKKKKKVNRPTKLTSVYDTYYEGNDQVGKESNPDA